MIAPFLKRFCLLISVVIGVMHAPSATANELFALRDQQGIMHPLSRYQGTWVIVNYWAPWCPPCLEEIPELVAFFDAHRHEKIMVLGVAVQYTDPSEISRYAEDMLISYPIILGEAQSKAIQRPEVLPTTYIYHPNGQLYRSKRGALTKQWLEQLIRDAAIKK